MSLVDSKGNPTAVVPEHLIEGHEAFEQWKKARQMAGIPLPPGATFILNKHVVLKDALVTYRARIAKRLQMPLSCVIVEVDWDDAGRLAPQTNVDPPDGWLEGWGGGKQVGTRVEDFAREHIVMVIKSEYQLLQMNLAERLQGLYQERPDLMPPVENALGDQSNKT